MMYDNTNANLTNYTNESDEDLIRKVKAGDNDALEFLLNKYKDIVFFYF